MYRFQGSRLGRLGAVLVLSYITSPPAVADLAACAAIADPESRLECFDRLAAADAAELQSTVIRAAEVPDAQEPLKRRFAYERQVRNNPFGLTAYQPNYLLPVTYSRKPNEEPFRELFPDGSLDNAEAKLQISFRAQIWDISDRLSLWGGYTQESWWQVYNHDESAPFRETNYQPEIFLSYLTDVELFGFRMNSATLSLNHQSNGRSEVLSRSWNRVIAGALLERGSFVLQPRLWWRIPEDDENDDNPRTDDFYGYGDLRMAYNWRDMTFATTLRNNLRADNKGSVQLDWSFPLNGRFKGYVQYFDGYGESLIDYNVRTQRIGVGVMLTDLL